MHKLFIGYDPRQAVSYTTLVHSISANAKEPVSITPLVIDTLPLKRQGLTPFTWSRFLVPYLCGYTGTGLFLDADMLVLGDISEVFRLAETGRAVYIQNDQPPFERASMMLFNCGHPANAVLTPDVIENRAKGFHAISWITDPKDIGDIPREWNVCIPYTSEPPANPKLLHFTQGVPFWWETKDQPHADAWSDAYMAAGTASHSWYQLMGSSVHARPVLERLIRTGVVKDEMDYARKAGLIKEAAE